jgi:hypothetical protein
MKNLRTSDPDNPDVHEDFVIRHGHISRISDTERRRLNDQSDFCIGQVSGRIQDCEDVKSGSQYFIEDNTPDKQVRTVFESAPLDRGDDHYTTQTSYSRSDIVFIYSERYK